MELAKVTSKGQITIPIEIRKKLGIKEGSKVLFLEEAGRIYLANSSMEALREAELHLQERRRGLVWRQKKMLWRWLRSCERKER